MQGMGGYPNGGAMDGGFSGGMEGPGQPSSSDACAVFVSNMQWWTTDVDLESACSQYGAVQGIRFIEDRACGKSRGMAVVEFDSPQAAQACIDGMNGRDINGRPCKVIRQIHKQGQHMMGGGGGGPVMGRGGPGRGGMMGGVRGRGGRGSGGMPPQMEDPSMMGMGVMDGSGGGGGMMGMPWGGPGMMMGGPGGPGMMGGPPGQMMGGGMPPHGMGFKPPPPPMN